MEYIWVYPCVGIKTRQVRTPSRGRTARSPPTRDFVAVCHQTATEILLICQMAPLAVTSQDNTLGTITAGFPSLLKLPR